MFQTLTFLGFVTRCEKHLRNLATCKDCAARVEEHEVRLGVARSKMDTQALLSMAQHGSAWRSMAQHGAACFSGWRDLAFFFRERPFSVQPSPLAFVI